MSAINRLIDALHEQGVRKAGGGGYRARCPVCGITSNGTLSFRETVDGAVLLKCFKSECCVEQIAAAVGLTVTDLFPPRDSQGSPMKRRGLLTAQEALDMLDTDMQIGVLVISEFLHGGDVSVEDYSRLIAAANHIGYLRQEVRS